MKVIAGGIILMLFIVSLGFSDDYRTTTRQGGFVVMFNPENQKGIVYKSKEATSRLIVLYPSTNSAFVYSTNGQDVFDLEAVRILLDNKVLRDSIGKSILAIIVPFAEKGGVEQ